MDRLSEEFDGSLHPARAATFLEDGGTVATGTVFSQQILLRDARRGHVHGHRMIC